MPLTAAEIVKHPEFEHVTWDLKPAKKGKTTVAIGRGGPIRIAYEIHGHGPIKLVVWPGATWAFLRCKNSFAFDFEFRITTLARPCITNQSMLNSMRSMGYSC